jgi:hypothetical protein
VAFAGVRFCIEVEALLAGASRDTGGCRTFFVVGKVRARHRAASFHKRADRRSRVDCGIVAQRISPNAKHLQKSDGRVDLIPPARLESLCLCAFRGGVKFLKKVFDEPARFATFAALPNAGSLTKSGRQQTI